MVCSVLDIVYLIVSYADDETLFKLSQVNKQFRSILYEGNIPTKSPTRSLRDPKDFKIRIMNHKLKKCQRNLDSVVNKI